MTSGFSEFLEEMFAPLGGVSMRRMFGGIGIWREGLMFALAADDVLYFKADEETVPLFEAEGSAPFTYTAKDGRTTVMSFWRAPERVFDDPDALTEFARHASAAARRADAKKAAKAARKSRPVGTD
ncbi:MAG TPA: TfoX/Sxy family protein [Methylomirabilota bacterium]|nr:TfoX/Sxy family protein [Methylomirabilota bacterium]